MGETNGENKFIPKLLSKDEIVEFVEQLMITINWVDLHIQGHNFQGKDHNRVLRQTNPIIHGKPLYRFHETLPKVDLNFELYDPKEYQAAFAEALKSRDRNLNVDFKNIEEKGRIICFETGLTTHDGVPVVESYGFVDTYDIPPIDTWFYLKFEFDYAELLSLFCWIPKAAEEIMEHTMSVEIFDSYTWLDTKHPKLFEKIKQELNNFR